MNAEERHWSTLNWHDDDPRWMNKPFKWFIDEDMSPANVAELVEDFIKADRESEYQRGLRKLKADIETNIKYAEGRGISMPWSREDIVKIIEKLMEVKS